MCCISLENAWQNLGYKIEYILLITEFRLGYYFVNGELYEVFSEK